MQTYIETHDLTSILSETVNACTKFQPEDPLRFMANYLRRKTSGVITKLFARMILDSRGVPTTEVEIHTRKGIVTAACPGGSCIGIYEKRELRDEDPRRFSGTGVDRCVNYINETIAPRLLGENPINQLDVDRLLTEGPANAVHPVSLAVCKAGAIECDITLHRHIANLAGVSSAETQNVRTLPMFTIIEGGSMFIQEVYLVPIGATSFMDAVRMGVEVFQHFKRNVSNATGPNGGIVPTATVGVKQDLDSILSDVIKAIARARHTGKVRLGLNVNASELLTEDNRYDINLDKGAPDKKTADEMMSLYENLISKFPIHSIEDPFDADDYESFKRFTAKGLCKVLGTNVFCSCPKRAEIGARDKWCDALVLKPNQAGTLTDALRTAKTVIDNGMELVVSDRTGSTDDPFIADLSFALNAHFVKAGAPGRATIYNRFLSI